MDPLAWIDREEYPFTSNYLELEMGRMHYVDEGEGPVLLMVHGNPSWSFLYRKMIEGLSDSYRCVAMDHIGFGLSDKPYDWTYLPQAHAENLEQLIKHLGLKDITLVVQDWGGPIGLSYAVENPENVKGLIIMNTWMWSVKGDKHYERFSGFMGGPMGRFLIRRFNFFVKGVMKKATGDKSKLTKPIHDHYKRPLGSPKERKGCWVFPKQIIGASEWLDTLWNQRDNIATKPALLLWGEKDIAFRQKELNRWKELFVDPTVHTFAETGHFVQEEQGENLVPLVDTFMSTMS